MKNKLLALTLSLIMLVSAIPAGAIGMVGVESAAETATTQAAGEDASLAADYTPSASEYVTKYGRVVFWEGYEGYEAGTNAQSSNFALFNQNSGSGLTYAGPLKGAVAAYADADGEIKYATVSKGGKYQGASGTQNPGTYTLVIRARRAASAKEAGVTSRIDFYVRRANVSDGTYQVACGGYNLTDTFTDYIYTYVHGADTKPFNQLLVNILNGDIEVDSMGMYYKYVPAASEYEKSEYGETIFWEGYEEYDEGASVSGDPIVINSSNSSGATKSAILDGTVGIAEDGKHYVAFSGTRWNGISGGKTAAAGTYTLVVRARKGTTDRATFYIRGRGPKADGSGEEDKNWPDSTKSFTLTDTFADYVVTCNYTPSDAGYLNQLLPQVSNTANIQVDSYAFYYKPFPDYAPGTIQAAQIRTDVDNYQGMRYAAYVDDERKAKAVEYGYIIALGSSFASEDEYENLVFDASMSESGTNTNGIKYVTGKAYVKDSFDKVYSMTGEEFGLDVPGTYYTAVLYNIQDYEMLLVGRPYLKTEDGTVYYGDAVARSVKDVAQNMVNAEWGGDATLAPEYIQTILGVNAGE